MAAGFPFSWGDDKGLGVASAGLRDNLTCPPFAHSGLRLFGSKCLFRPLQQSM
jgi:hypothetical protein